MRAHVVGLGLAVAVIVLAAVVSTSSLAASVAIAPEAAGARALVGVLPSTVAITKNVTVGKSPLGVAYDPATQSVYVANYGAGTVSVISGSTNKVTKTITVGKQPDVLLYDPTNSEMYVVNQGSSSVSIISTANKVVATVPLAGNADGDPVYDPSNGDVYLATDSLSLHGFYYNVTRIDHSTNAPTALPVGDGPNFVVYDNATTEIIVSNALANSISRVNSSTNAVTTVKLTKGTLPFEEIYDAVDRDVYVLDEGSAKGNVSVYGTTHKIVATIAVGVSPTFASVDPSTGTVFVTNPGHVNTTTGKYPSGTVSVISTANKLKATVTVGKESFLATYDPTTGDVYVPCVESNATYVIDATTFKLVGSAISTPQFPDVAFYLPSHQEMLIFGYSNETGTPTTTTVTVISSSNAVAATLTLPKGPVAGGVYDPKNQDGYISNEKAGSVSVLH